MRIANKLYSSPRITKELRALGRRVSKNRIADMMRAAEIRARMPRKFIVTTDSKHNYPIVLNVLERRFLATRENEIWISDISYVRTNSGWLYLTVIIDIYNRKVIGWPDDHWPVSWATIVPTWLMATKSRPITQPLIFHSDRGIQYACSAFLSILKSNH